MAITIIMSLTICKFYVQIVIQFSQVIVALMLINILNILIKNQYDVGVAQRQEATVLEAVQGRFESYHPHH